jgi:hypothetical protein
LRVLAEDSPADVHEEDEKQGARDRLIRFSKEHWVVLIVIAIMLAAFLVRLYYLSKHVESTADSYYFLILARSIRDTFTYTVRGVAHTKYLPGYPILIWLGGYLTGGLERSADLIAILGGTFTVLVTYGIGRELFNKWAGVAAALIVAFQPTFLKWTVLPMTEGLFTLLFAAGVYLALTGCKRASPARRVLASVAGGWCFLVRWEGILLLPLIVLIMIIYFKESELKLWEPFVMLFFFGLPMGIYVTRNLIVTGKVTSYVGEFREYSTKVTFPVLKHRAKVYIWNGMSDAIFSVVFLLGSVWLLVRRKFKAFLVVVGWFALFAGFHLFWYYAYERFMAPAVPAVGLVIGFLFVDLMMLSWAFFKEDGWFTRKAWRVSGPPDGTEPGTGDAPVPEGEGELADEAEPESRVQRRSRGLSQGRRTGLRVAQVTCVVILAALFSLMMWHGIARADRVIKEDYKAFLDDHGGRFGMTRAAEWLNANAPGKLVAASAGPYFEWLYYPGDVLYLRPVPWDLPVEPADVAYVEVPRRLYERGVRYMVVTETDRSLAEELKLYGIVGSNLPYIRRVASWTAHYTYPDDHDVTTVIFEVLPPARTNH